MDDGAIWSSLVSSVYDGLELEDQWPNARPFLAHYTSLDALESILKSDEIWLSNPLFMNDLDEVTFGIVHGATKIKSDDRIRDALGSAARHTSFSNGLDYYITQFVDKHLLDTYVFCMSEHDPRNNDGMLSMWRGYGGNGRGAALEHLLTLELSNAGRPGCGWLVTVDKERARLARKLTTTSRQHLEAELPALYAGLRWPVARQLEKDGVPPKSLPYVCPYTLEQILDPEWLPKKMHGIEDPAP